MGMLPSTDLRSIKILIKSGTLFEKYFKISACLLAAAIDASGCQDLKLIAALPAVQSQI
jgi:hypothetical protein